MIQIACVVGCALPEWARRGFRIAFVKASKGELKSWDQVFGRPPTKLESRRFNRECANRDKIWNMVAAAKATGLQLTRRIR